MKKTALFIIAILALACIVVSCNNNVEPKNYKVTFDANGGTGEMGAQEMAKNTANALSENKFTRQYYSFSGWATSADGEKVYDDKQEITPTSDLTLYAIWTRITYKVKFDKGYGTGDPMPDQVFNAGEEKALSANTYTNDGYLFAGWSTDNTANITYTDEQSITVTSDITLYAVWGDLFTGRWVLEGDESSFITFDGVGGFSMSINLGGGNKIEGEGDYVKEGEILQPLYIEVAHNFIGFDIAQSYQTEEPYAFAKFGDFTPPALPTTVKVLSAETQTVAISAYTNPEVSEFNDLTFDDDRFDFKFDVGIAFGEVFIDTSIKSMKFMVGYSADVNGSISADGFVFSVNFNPDNPLTLNLDPTKWLMECYRGEQHQNYYCNFILGEDDLTLDLNYNGSSRILNFTRQV